MGGNYSSIYSTIQTKRETAKQRLSEYEKPLGRFRTQQFVDPSVWAKERKERQRRHALRLRKKQATEETKTYIYELGEQEKQIKKYEKQGYKVEKTDKGYKFTRKVSGGGGGGYVGDYSIRITWRRSSGETVTTQGNASNYDRMVSQIESRNGTVISVESLGGGRQHRTPDMPSTETGFLMYKAEPQQRHLIVERSQPMLITDSSKILDIRSKTTPPPSSYYGQTHVSSFRKAPGTTGTLYELTGQKGLRTEQEIEASEGVKPVDIALTRSDWEIKRESITEPLEMRHVFEKRLGEQHLGIIKEGEQEYIVPLSVALEPSAWEKKQKQWSKEPGWMKGFRRGAAHWISGVPNPSYIAAWLRKDWKTTESIAKSAQRRWWGAGKDFETGKTDPFVRFKDVFFDLPITKYAVEPAVTAYGFGLGMGALKKTEWGAKTLLRSRGVWKSAKHGKLVTKLFKPSVGKPLWTISRSQAVELGIAGFYMKDLPKSVSEYPLETGIGLATTLPVVGYFYKAGHRAGGAYVERLGGMSRVKGVQRVQQKAVYESIDTIEALKPVPKKKGFIFDLTSVKKIGKRKALQLTSFIKGERWRRTKPTIMGSTAMEFYNIPYSPLPKSTQRWITNILRKGGHKVGLIGDRPPMDIDLGLRNVFLSLDDVGSRFSRMFPSKRFSHIIERTKGSPKAGRELYPGFGGRELSKSRVKFYDPWLSDIDIRTLPQEQMSGAWGMTPVYYKPKYRGFKYSDSGQIGYTLETKPMILMSKTVMKKLPSGGYWTMPTTPSQTAYLGRFNIKGMDIHIPPKINLRTISGLSVLRHEIGHQRFSQISTLTPSIKDRYFHIGEWFNELLEAPAFRISKLEVAMKHFIKTGEWKFKGEVMSVRAMKPMEQFYRTSRAIAPSEWKSYTTPSGVVQSGQAYRLGKDVQRWWNIGKATAQKNLQSISPFKRINAQRLLDSMSKYAEPWKHKIPDVTIGEKLLKKLGGEAKPISYGVDTYGTYPIYPKSVYPSIVKPYGLGIYPSKTSIYPSKTFYDSKYPINLSKVLPPRLFYIREKHEDKPPIVPPPIPPYDTPPYKPIPPTKISTPAPPIRIYSKDITLPKSTIYKKITEGKRKKRRRYEDIPGKRRKPLMGLKTIDMPSFKFRKFKIESILKGVKI